MSLFIKKSGILTSLQGLGSFGMQRFGVPPGGAMDRTAARIVNLLLGNDEGQEVLESHFPAPEIVFEKECFFALGGADFDAKLDGEPVSNWRVHRAQEGAVLHFPAKVSGNRCYLAVAGGFAPAVQDPLATFRTVPLRAGTRLNTLPIGPIAPARGSVSRSTIPAYSRFPTVRILAGAEYGSMNEDARAILRSADFKISNDSNRMGSRLKGPNLSIGDLTEMISSVVSFGTIQLLPDGQLIILMADHQTSGGYPRIGHVIGADLPLAGQLGAGDGIGFKIVEMGEAEQAADELESGLRRLGTAVRFGRYW